MIRGLGLQTHSKSRQRLRVVPSGSIDSNLREADLKKLRWIARKQDRSVASLVRVIVKEWLQMETMAGEFRDFHA